MKTEQLNKWLISHNACRPARDWLHASRAASAAEAWDKCERGDWLLWFAAKAGVDRKKLVLAACATARLVLHLVPAGEDRPRIAIETAEAWTRGEATLAEVRAAADAAYAAAAYAAAYAAYAAAYVAAYAAYAAAAAAAAYDDDDARTKMQAQCADAVRAVITWDDIVAACPELAVL